MKVGTAHAFPTLRSIAFSTLPFYFMLKSNNEKAQKNILLGIYLTIIVISSLISLAKVQLEQFNKAYIQEEVEEIEGLSKQVVWAVRPILRENNKNPTMVANLL